MQEIRKSPLQKIQKNKIKSKKNYGYLIQTWSDKAFEAAVMNLCMEDNFKSREQSL